MVQFSAEQFRQRLAGLESPERRFTDMELKELKDTGEELVLALRDVFGSSLDRKTVWERISNGLSIAAAKSRGKCDDFIAELIDFVKAETNVIVGSGRLNDVTNKILFYTPETQKMFIRTCVKYRMLLCLEAREKVQENKSLREQLNAGRVVVEADGSIQAWGAAD